MEVRINIPKPIDFSPSTASSAATHFGLSLKASIILLRWPVVLICSYLLLFPSGEYLSAIILNTFVVLFVVSNVAINFLDDSWFTSWSFYPPSQKATGVSPWMNARRVPPVALAEERSLRRVPPDEACGEVPRP